MSFIGEIAALFTSFCWSLSAIGFSNAGRDFSSNVTNRVRVTLAFLALLLINGVLYGQPIPFNAGLTRWGWLMLSGIVGLALGDAFLFRCYQLVGPRIGLLLLSLAPVFSAVIAWIFLGEKLNAIQFGGMAVTLAGIGWVVLSRSALQAGEGPSKLSLRGVLYGMISALGQASGLILSKVGMTGNFPPFAGTIIRMSAAIVFLWIMAAMQKELGSTAQSIRTHPSALGWTAFGAFFGPVIGVSASLMAVQHAEIGVASTLMALPPVFMLPVSYFIFKERFDWQAVAGTLLAILGVALLFMK
ncbi:MAG TPA: DMT family transporter [Anaerolineales bacterium]